MAEQPTVYIEAPLESELWQRYAIPASENHMEQLRVALESLKGACWREDSGCREAGAEK